MRRLSVSAARQLSSTAAARSAPLPALSSEGPKPTGFLASLLGGSTAPALPPMTEPLPGVAVPGYTPPAVAPVTQQKKLASGTVLAAEETPVRGAGRGVWRGRGGGSGAAERS